jgi:hypothetical protein
VPDDTRRSLKIKKELILKTMKEEVGWKKGKGF